MIRPATDIEVFLYAEPVDMRKSIDGLACLIEQETELSPFDHRVFVFCNRPCITVRWSDGLHFFSR